MNLAIIGRTEILYSTAELLRSRGHNIRLIVTAMEAPEYTRTAGDFEKLSRALGVRYLFTARIGDDENIEIIRGAGPMDVGISMNYPNVIPQKVIDLFPLGILNAHGGDLPLYRGNACQAWAIINGEDRIGLCIHKMVGGELDAGDIICREYLDVSINTKVGNAYKWMGRRIPDLFLEALIKLENNRNYILATQSTRPEDALRCYPRMPEDGRIDWNRSNIEILRLINASSEPYSGAFCEYEGEKMILWEAELYEDGERYCSIPGQVADIDRNEGHIIVITGNGKIKIKEIEFKGLRTAPKSIVKSIRKRLK